MMPGGKEIGPKEYLIVHLCGRWTQDPNLTDTDCEQIVSQRVDADLAQISDPKKQTLYLELIKTAVQDAFGQKCKPAAKKANGAYTETLSRCMLDVYADERPVKTFLNSDAQDEMLLLSETMQRALVFAREGQNALPRASLWSQVKRGDGSFAAYLRKLMAELKDPFIAYQADRIYREALSRVSDGERDAAREKVSGAVQKYVDAELSGMKGAKGMTAVQLKLLARDNLAGTMALGAGTAPNYEVTLVNIAPYLFTPAAVGQEGEIDELPLATKEDLRTKFSELLERGVGTPTINAVYQRAQKFAEAIREKAREDED